MVCFICVYTGFSDEIVVASDSYQLKCDDGSYELCWFSSNKWMSDFNLLRFKPSGYYEFYIRKNDGTPYSGVTWQDSNIFENLEKENYSFIARFKETKTHQSSPLSKAVNVAFPYQPKKPIPSWIFAASGGGLALILTVVIFLAKKFKNKKS